MGILVNILFMVMSSETFKALLKKGTRKLVETSGVSIDNELAIALLKDVAESNGNRFGEDVDGSKVGKEVVSNIIQGLTHA